MKCRSFLTITLCASLLLLSCSKDEMGVYSDSYFYVSINGPSLNGEYRIDADDDMSQLETTGVIAPSNDPMLPDALIITYHDYVDMDVNMTVPAEERLTELLDGSVFGMGIRVGEVLLVSSSTSIHVTKLTKTSGGVPGFEQPEVVIANFEGVMIYKNEMNVEETHTVKGDFKFYQRF